MLRNDSLEDDIVLSLSTYCPHLRLHSLSLDGVLAFLETNVLLPKIAYRFDTEF